MSVNKMQSGRLQIRQKMAFSLFVMLILFGVIFFRLGYVQIVKGNEWRLAAEALRKREISIPAPRGEIYDRNGNKLAVSIGLDSIAVYPPDIKKANKEAEVAAVLSRILEIPYDTVYGRVVSQRAFEWIKRKVTPEQAKAIREANLPGIGFIEEPQRVYPEGKLAAHVLGFAGIDNQGLSGIEIYFENTLKGTPGSRIFETDAKGREIEGSVLEYLPPVKGLSIVLTIDREIQKICERELDNLMASANPPKSASILMMDPKTGEILAMASRPAYDPNNYSLSPASTYRNPLLNDAYEPGSTFKIITAAVALEEGVAKLTDRFYDPGYYMVGRQRVGCWRSYNPHGSQTFSEVMQNSCNPGFVEVGFRIEDKKKGLFYEYIRGFGFGEKTGITLSGESSGLMINESRLIPLDIATISIGQSISVTPLQMVSAVSAIANGGTLLKPQIVRQILDGDGNVVKDFKVEEVRKVISASTAETVCELLEDVVTLGTGRSAYIPGYRVGGKTGTAQKPGVGGYLQGKYVASFLGMAPVDDPRVVCLVIIDEPSGYLYQGGQVAAPVFKAVMEDVLMNVLKVTPQSPSGSGGQTNPQNVKNVAVPDVRNLSPAAATQVLRQYGFEVKVEGSGDQVTGLSPVANALVREGSTVTLRTGTGGETLVMPDLTGLRLNAVSNILGAMGLKLVSSGSGIVLEQKPIPGSTVRAGDSINVTFGEEKPLDTMGP
ncbi:MAG: penicillin-binding transpeptidase domain-containing protein [Clostridiales bacterium]|nr:penicillin-binding transpeptidase domain-containing protein [Clostridiales bacterium]